MSLSANIAGVAVDVSTIDRPDTIDQRTTCNVTVIDKTGTALYQKGNPITITDSILGIIFQGYVNQPSSTKLYPNPGLIWALDCVARGDYLAGKRTSNKSYNNQYGGTIVVDQVQRYGASEGLKANAALRWDELQSDWSAGTLSNTVAATSVTNGNPGGGDLELSLAGTDVKVTGNGGAGFGIFPGLKLTGYASSGYVNAYTYRQIWAGTQPISTQLDVLSYDVWISSTSPSIRGAVDFICSDGSTLRDSVVLDTQSMSPHPATDLSGLANDQWYHRVIFISGALDGKTIVSFSVAFEGDDQGTYTAYFKNIIFSHNNGTSYVDTNIFTNTLQMNSQIGNIGYSNVSLSQILVQNKSFLVGHPPVSISAAGIVKSSQISFSAALPENGTALAETSIDNQATWQAVESGDAIPNLLPGMSVAGRSLYYRFSMSLGTEPVENVGFGSPHIVVKSAYNTSKSDAITTYTTANDFLGGTLTALKTVGANPLQGVTLNGIQRNWDDGFFGSQPFFGAGTQVVRNRQFEITANATSDFKCRLDFALTWHNFVAEVDIEAISANTSASFEYRTTGWQNTNNTGGYVIDVFTNVLNFGYGSNTSTGAGGYTSIASVAVSLTANSMHRLKVVVNGANHQIFLDNVRYVNANNSVYSQYSLTVLGDGPSAYHRMNEASGTVLHDASPNGRDGTINATGTTYAQAGAISTDLDTAMKFDGVAGRALMNSTVNPAGLSHITIECWAKLTSNTFTGNPRLVANGHTDTLFTGMQLWINTTSHVMMDVGNGTSHGLATAPTALVAGVWAHIVGTYDGANVRIYVNSVLAATTAFTGNIASTTFACGIGYNPVYSGDFFPGTVDEVVVYPSTLSQAQITAHYQAGLTMMVTSASAGSLGFRVFNNTAAPVAVSFDNFGVCESLTGIWQGPSISLAGAGTYGNSILIWDIDGLPDGTTVISAQTSIDGGSSYQSVLNGGSIPGLTIGQSLTGVNLLIRMTLIAANAPVIPTLNGVTVWIIGKYTSIGTRISPSLSLTNVGRAATAITNWNATTPEGTSLTVQTSINSGTSWQTLTMPSDPITYINTQPDPNEDIFAEDSHLDYTQGNFGGTTGTWTWDTTHSRLSGASGVNGTLTALAALTSADSQVMAVFDQCDGSGLLSNYAVNATGYYVQIWDASGTGTPNRVKLFRRASSTNTQVGSTATITFVRGTPHLFTLDVQAGVITVIMDGVTLITYTDGSPLSAGKSGLLLNTLAQVYSLRIQQYGEDVSSLSLLTKLTLTSTDPTRTPQVLDMQAMVSSPDIGEGILIPSTSYVRTFLSDNIDDQKQKSDYWTTWRNDNTLLFQAREAIPAPFVLSSLNSQIINGQVINDILVDGASLDNSADSYRNRQIIQGAIATAVFKEIKFGDGATTSWAVTNPLAAPPESITLNGLSRTFGIQGIDTGRDFYYQIGSTSIDIDSSLAVLNEADSFEIIYLGSYSQDIELNNTGQFPGTISQSMMAAIENSDGGSSSGIVESILDVSSTPTTVEAAIVQGNQLLQRYGNIGRTFRCKTLRSGLVPGMQVSLFVPEFNLSNTQMLLTSINVTLSAAPGVTGGLLYMWDLTLTEGPNLGSWVQLFTNALVPTQSSQGAVGGIMSTIFRQKNVLYVEDFGAIGDGLSNDTAALQACFDAATAGTDIHFAPVTYLVSASLLYPGGIKITGAGDADGGTEIKVKAGTALTTPVLCPAGWYNNATTSSDPVLVSDIAINGNSATSGTAAHGFVAMNYQSSFDRMSIYGVTGDGFLFTAHSKNGTHITNSCVEPKISRIQVRNVGGVAIHVHDDGTTLNSCTDGFLCDCIVENAGDDGIDVEMGPGWFISGNHVYGTVGGGLGVEKCFATRVNGNYIDGFGSGASTFIAGISMSVVDGRGSSCIGNVVGFESGAATGPYQGISITGAGSAQSVCTVAHNSVVGNSQAASNGYVIQAVTSQQTHPWIVYFHDNDATGVNHYSFFDSFTTGGDLQVLQHIASVQGTAPTVAAGSNAGTTPPVPVMTNCTDLDGKVTFGTGTTPALGNMVVLTFNKAYAIAPTVIVTPINDATAALRWNITTTTTNFTYRVGVAPSASQANTVYGFYYHVLA